MSFTVLQVLHEAGCAQSCPTLCNPMDYNLEALQAILEWVAMPSLPRGSSQPRDWTQVSHITGKFFTVWAIRKAQPYIYQTLVSYYLWRLFCEVLLTLKLVNNWVIAPRGNKLGTCEPITFSSGDTQLCASAWNTEPTADSSITYAQMKLTFSPEGPFKQ